MKGLRLRLPPRPEPVLTPDELEVIDMLLAQHLGWVKREKGKGPVSEAILRVESHAQNARMKIGEALNG